MQINVSHYQQISNCCRPDVGQSPTLARPAVALAHCIQQISCTSIATYRMLPKLISVDKNSSFMEKKQQKLVAMATSRDQKYNFR